MNLNNDKLNILLISPLPPPAGGIATWTETYLKSQQFKEHSVSVVNTSIVGYRMTNFNKIKIFDEIGRNIRIYNQVMDNMKKVRYDIVHFNTSCSKFGMIRDHFCLKKIKKFENKLILQCHCNIPQLINTRAKKFLFSRIIKSADIIITLNTESNNYLEQQFKKKGVVFANFIDEGILPHEKSRIISEKINNVIFVGHIEKMKGLLEIIDVAKLMPDICFRMIGSISEDFNLDSIPDNLTFTGEVTQEIVFNEMNNADIFLFPSHSEGFPIVILEAMAHGLPIIASRVGAIPDIIDNKGGILVEVGDIPAITKAIMDLSNKKIRMNISNWNIRKVESIFTSKVVLNKLLVLYRGQ